MLRKNLLTDYAWIQTVPDLAVNRYSGKGETFYALSERIFFKYAPTSYTETVSCQFNEQKGKFDVGLQGSKSRYERANPTKINFGIFLTNDIMAELGADQGIKSIYKEDIASVLKTLLNWQKNFYKQNAMGNNLLELGGMIIPSVFGYLTNVTIKSILHDKFNRNAISRADIDIEFTEKPVKQSWLDSSGKALEDIEKNLNKKNNKTSKAGTLDAKKERVNRKDRGIDRYNKSAWSIKSY
ncbi:MAG: hypothetical protein KKD01_19925 [Proteobacteria bacterium]|nr:hypothetical protein [Pseudomonadota bacterium]